MLGDADVDADADVDVDADGEVDVDVAGVQGVAVSIGLQGASRLQHRVAGRGVPKLAAKPLLRTN